MKIKVNDNVLVITGKDKGKTGKVTKVYKKTNKVVVEKLNIRIKHIKKTNQRAGEKISFEAPMDASNVMIIDPKEGKPTRVGYKKLEKNKKERISRLSGTSLDNISVAAKVQTKKAPAAKPKKKVVKA
jgi:large subunit ribosomal protein L24